MTEKRLSLGINVSILLILTIFGVLLSLPLRLLLDTNYDSRNQSNENSNGTGPSIERKSLDLPVMIDFRKLRRCPMLEYENRMKSIFYGYYDQNCTFVRIQQMVKIEEDKQEENIERAIKREDQGMCEPREVPVQTPENIETEVPKTRRIKSIPLTGNYNVLVMMLLVSAIAAFIEVLRIRFAKDKVDEDCGIYSALDNKLINLQDSSAGGTTVASRRSSNVNLPVQRRFVPREPMKSQRSFEMQGMHRSALRLLGARPPPLIRRSSFPTQSKQFTPSISGTPTTKMSRRQSAESDEEIGFLINALHHRTRLIRRH